MAAFRSQRWAFALVGLVGLGCNGPEVTPSDTADVQSGLIGVLHIERTAKGEVASGAHDTVSGAFARYRGLSSEEVPELLGLGSVSEPAEGCRTTSQNMSGIALPGAGIELLDAGVLELEVDGVRTTILPRTFPELAGFVSGVFY